MTSQASGVWRGFLITAIAGLASCTWVCIAAGQVIESTLVQPMVTRFGRSSEHIVFAAGVRSFTNVELQEAEDFDGITVDLELTVPLWKRWQVRLASPVYTTGEARLIGGSGAKIDIDGAGGTYDFATAQLEYQLLTQKNDGGAWNVALGGGYGIVPQPLETSIGDLYNHSGEQVLGGVRADRALNEFITLVGNLGVRYYFDSDDLNPSDESSTFFLVDLNLAGVFDPWNHLVYPAVELNVSSDFDRYTAVQLIPEAIWPVARRFALKVGVVIGLSDDGEDLGGRFAGSVAF